MGAVRVACVGAGYWGKNLVRNFAAAEGASLVAVCDFDAAVQEKMRREHPSARVTGDWASIVGDPNIDAVVLATPGSSHARLAAEALEAGKDVFVEKPLAQSVADAVRVTELAARKGRVLMVGHLMLFHPAFEKVVEYVRGGELGEVLYIYAERVNLGKLRTDENALWSLGPHDLSMIFALVDEPMTSIAARGHAYLRPGTEDVVFVNAGFRGGVMANVHLSWLDPHKHRKLTVVGSKKMLVFDDTHPSEKIYIHDKGFDRPQEYHSYDAFLTLRDGDTFVPRVALEEPLRREVKHFIDCCQSRATPRSGGAEGVRVVEALAAAEASLKRGGAPIVLG
ncbi:MAG: Gfo/Idh/MocA family oxidoreductase [Myxococcales bacterium]|nr:Gfo/Idh/MocA family oxidoreductase [Myxococcales bacterium]